jgi:hypothetical protein
MSVVSRGPSGASGGSKKKREKKKENKYLDKTVR